MNVLEAEVTAVESTNHLSLVDLNVQGDRFTVVVVETPDTAEYLAAGTKVKITFKETEMALSRDPHPAISLRNRLSCKVAALNEGTLLTAVDLDYRGVSLQSIITTRSARELSLRIGDPVTALLKTNDISILYR